jgi:DnaJ domain
LPVTPAEFDPFEVLGVRPGSSHDQIRKAYREKVARYHPDKHRGNPLEELAADKLRAINRAYEMLSQGERARPTRPAPSSPVPRARQPQDPLARLARGAGMLVAALFLFRFGFGLVREVFVVLRGAVMGVFWLLRSNPIFLIAVLIGLGMLTAYYRKGRPRER